MAWWTSLVGLNLLLLFNVINGEEKVLICSMTSWSVYTSERGQFFASYIPPNLCTHILYSYAGIDEATYEIKIIDPISDIGSENDDVPGYDNIKNLVALKERNPKLKVLITIGSWSIPTTAFPSIAAFPDRLSIFVSSVNNYTQKYGFDGVDIDWQLPAERGAPPSDRDLHVSLLQALRVGLPDDKMLTVQISGHKSHLDTCYDLRRMSSYVDYVILQTDWYNRPAERMTGPVAPLYGTDPSHQMNVEFSLDYALARGVPKEKLVLGFCTSSYATVLKYPTVEGKYFYQPSVETFLGPWSLSSGVITYGEVCYLIKSDTRWKISWDDDSFTPFMYKNNELIVYDNKISFEAKAKLIGSRNLAGAMVYRMEYDDFKGRCHGTRYPLITVLKEYLNSSSARSSSPPPINKEVKSVLADFRGTRKLFCYVASWASWRPNQGKFHAGHIDPFLCTHIVWSFAGMDEKDYSIISRDIRSDYYNTSSDSEQYGNIAQLVSLKRFNRNLKVVISIGGYSEGSVKYSKMARNADSRRKFIRNVLIYIKKHNLDGVDLDWEYPTERGGSADDKTNLVDLLKEMKASLSPDYLLTIHMHGRKYFIDSGYDVKEISDTVDYINLVAYHYSGPWDLITEPNSPLHSQNDLNVESSVKYVLERGADPNKVLLGISTFGHAYILDRQPISGQYFNQASQKTFRGEWTNEEGFIGFHEICWALSRQTDYLGEETRWKEAWHESSSTPYAYLGTKFISYDNIRSISEKVKLIKEHSLGGGMVFYLDTDDFLGRCYGRRFPLTSLIKNTLLSQDIINKIDSQSNVDIVENEEI